MIDISEKIKELRKQCKVMMVCQDYEDAGLDRMVQENLFADEVAKLWGFSGERRNECGWADYDFEEVETIELLSKDVGCMTNEIRIGKSPNGMFTNALSYGIGTSGYGEPLSIFSGKQFETREEALDEGFLRIILGVMSMSDGQENWVPKKKKFIKNAIEKRKLLLPEAKDISIKKLEEILAQQKKEQEEREAEWRKEEALSDDSQESAADEIIDIQDMRVQEIEEAQVVSDKPKQVECEQLSLFDGG